MSNVSVQQQEPVADAAENNSIHPGSPVARALQLMEPGVLQMEQGAVIPQVCLPVMRNGALHLGSQEGGLHGGHMSVNHELFSHPMDLSDLTRDLEQQRLAAQRNDGAPEGNHPEQFEAPNLHRIGDVVAMFLNYFRILFVCNKCKSSKLALNIVLRLIAHLILMSVNKRVNLLSSTVQHGNPPNLMQLTRCQWVLTEKLIEMFLFFYF